VALSKRPIVDVFDTTWLGDPESGEMSIEIADDFLGIYLPSGETRIPWTDIASLDIDIPIANWTKAKWAHRILSTMDALESATSDGVMANTNMRRGNSDIEVRVVRKDGTEVVGWARKHQPLGYPEPEAEAAKTILQGRVRNSGV